MQQKRLIMSLSKMSGMPPMVVQGLWAQAASDSKDVAGLLRLIARAIDLLCDLPVESAEQLWTMVWLDGLVSDEVFRAAGEPGAYAELVVLDLDEAEKSGLAAEVRESGWQTLNEIV